MKEKLKQPERKPSKALEQSFSERRGSQWIQSRNSASSALKETVWLLCTLPFLLQSSRDLAPLISIDENVEQLGLLPALLGMPITLGRWYVPKGAVSTLGYEP